MEKDSHSDDEIKKFYTLKNIAVVGMSKNEDKPAHYVPKYLIDHGYNVIPVNPTATEILGCKSYPTVSSIPDNIKKEGIKVIWMQEGIYSKEAEKMAKEKDISAVYNRCMMAEHRRLFND